MQQRIRGLDDITNAMEMNLSELQELVRNREAWGSGTAPTGAGLVTWQGRGSLQRPWGCTGTL